MHAKRQLTSRFKKFEVLCDDLQSQAEIKYNFNKDIKT